MGQESPEISDLTQKNPRYDWKDKIFINLAQRLGNSHKQFDTIYFRSSKILAIMGHPSDMSCTVMLIKGRNALRIALGFLS
jgi:hypothetical protein